MNERDQDTISLKAFWDAVRKHLTEFHHLTQTRSHELTDKLEKTHDAIWLHEDIYTFSAQLADAKDFEANYPEHQRRSDQIWEFSLRRAKLSHKLTQGRKSREVVFKPSSKAKAVTTFAGTASKQSAFPAVITKARASASSI